MRHYHSPFDSSHEFLSDDVALHIPGTFDPGPTNYKSVLRVKKGGSPVDKEGDAEGQRRGRGRGFGVTAHQSASAFEPLNHLSAELPQKMMKKKGKLATGPFSTVKRCVAESKMCHYFTLELIMGFGSPIVGVTPQPSSCL